MMVFYPIRTEVDPHRELMPMPQQSSAIKIADHLHRAGAELLAGGLDELLRGYGSVCYSGSYYLDLMAWPDLDIYYPLDPSQEYLTKFLGLGPRLASVCQLISLRFKNDVRYPEGQLPYGLYWGVRAEQNSSLRWKLDIWALPPAVIDANQTELDRLKSKLTPKKRTLILEFKQALLTPEGRTPIHSGYHIYCAVLDLGMHAIGEVKEYLKNQGVSI
jgi:hypothetical protein